MGREGKPKLIPHYPAANAINYGSSHLGRPDVLTALRPTPKDSASKRLDTLARHANRHRGKAGIRKRSEIDMIHALQTAHSTHASENAAIKTQMTNEARDQVKNIQRTTHQQLAEARQDPDLNAQSAQQRHNYARKLHIQVAQERQSFADQQAIDLQQNATRQDQARDAARQASIKTRETWTEIMQGRRQDSSGDSNVRQAHTNANGVHKTINQLRQEINADGQQLESDIGSIMAGVRADQQRLYDDALTEYRTKVADLVNPARQVYEDTAKVYSEGNRALSTVKEQAHQWIYNPLPNSEPLPTIAVSGNKDQQDPFPHRFYEFISSSGNDKLFRGAGIDRREVKKLVDKSFPDYYKNKINFAPTQPPTPEYELILSAWLLQKTHILLQYQRTLSFNSADLLGTLKNHEQLLQNVGFDTEIIENIRSYLTKQKGDVVFHADDNTANLFAALSALTFFDKESRAIWDNISPQLNANQQAAETKAQEIIHQRRNEIRQRGQQITEREAKLSISHDDIAQAVTITVRYLTGDYADLPYGAQLTNILSYTDATALVRELQRLTALKKSVSPFSPSYSLIKTVQKFVAVAERARAEEDGHIDWCNGELQRLQAERSTIEQRAFSSPIPQQLDNFETRNAFAATEARRLAEIGLQVLGHARGEFNSASIYQEYLLSLFSDDRSQAIAQALTKFRELQYRGANIPPSSDDYMLIPALQRFEAIVRPAIQQEANINQRLQEQIAAIDATLRSDDFVTQQFNLNRGHLLRTLKSAVPSAFLTFAPPIITFAYEFIHEISDSFARQGGGGSTGWPTPSPLFYLLTGVGGAGLSLVFKAINALRYKN